MEAVNQSDSELDELSSGAESLDGWPSSDDNDLGGDRSDDFHSSDDETLSSVAKNIPGRAQQPRGKGKKKVYKFDTRKPFTPPPDIDFANVTLEPEPTDGTPYEYFKKFVNDDMFDNLATESNNYAHQKSGINLKTTASELETFVGMYFHMGVVKMPSVGCCWEAETRYPAVADMMSRNRFQKITSYLHIKDNILVTDAEKLDRAWKIRCWLDDLNANFATVSPSEYQCVDEIMVAFKGRSLLKQYLPKKPTKWGFKLWARCAATGFLHVFDIYQGKGTGMGTDGETTNNISLVRWLDNRCVTVVSSYLGALPPDSVRRYDRSKKEHINVDRPSIIGVYNKSMGGVDLMDMMCSLYKYQLRSKRWYLYIFYHTLTIALVNACFLYRRDCHELNADKSMCLRKFQSHVAAALCNSGKVLRGRPSRESAPKKRKVQVNPAPIVDVRLDGVDHLPTWEEKRQRCRLCPRGFSFVKCAKCRVHLCLNKGRNCFTAYHGK